MKRMTAADVAESAERGQARLDALVAAAQTLHVFIPHQRDNQCEVCGLDRMALCHQLQGRLGL